jgi:hypothetical protein
MLPETASDPHRPVRGYPSSAATVIVRPQHTLLRTPDATN